MDDYLEQFLGDVPDACDNCGASLCDAFVVYDDDGEETAEVSCVECGWVFERPDCWSEANWEASEQEPMWT